MGEEIAAIRDSQARGEHAPAPVAETPLRTLQ
jgi:hypothetical protein